MTKDRTRLLLIRDTFFEARRLVSGSPVDFDLLRAVWLADLSVELMLATIVSDFGLKSGQQTLKHSDYLNLIDKESDPTLDDLMRHKNNLVSLNKSRNRVHDGDSLSQSSARAAVLKVEGFLSEAFEKIFEADLETFSVLSFLRDSETKTELEKAQAAIDKGDYDEAAYRIASAYIKTEDLMREQSVAAGGFGGNPYRVLTPFQYRAQGGDFDMVGKDVRKAINNIAVTLELSRYGIETGATMDFLSSVQSVARGWGDREPMKLGDNRPFDETLVKWQLQYLADVVYRIERRATSRARP